MPNTVEIPASMSPVQLSVFYPEHSEALDAWYTDTHGDEMAWNHDDVFYVDQDGTLVVEPGEAQDCWFWHPGTHKWVQDGDDQLKVLFPGKLY